MGRAGCELFAAAGANVAAVDIDATRLNDVVEQVRAKGGTITGIVADLLDPGQCRRVVEDAASALGGIDVLWNHAGLPGASNVEQLDLDAYDRTMHLNVRSGLLVCGTAVPHMRQRGGGSVIFTAGLVGASSSPIYSAAKFAVVGLAKSLALRYAADNIRVNAICPGPVETPMLPLFFDPAADPVKAAQIQERVIGAIPLGRLGRAEEIAFAARWLASDEASFVTGAAIPVDGGFTAR